MVFSGVWAVAKNFVDEKTRKKITIIGGGYKKVLLENIAEENLPDFLGGTCKCEDKGGCLNSNFGPWDQFELVFEPKIGLKNKETNEYYPYPSMVPEAAKEEESK